MTVQLVTFIFDFILYAKCYAIHILLDRIKSNQIQVPLNHVKKLPVFCG